MSARRPVALAFLLIAAAAAVAVWRQDFGSALPFALFNDGRALYLLLARASLAVALGLVVIFGDELVRDRSTKVGGAARAFVVSFLVLEGMVTMLDVFVVSRPTASLGGPYREVVSATGSRAILRRPHDNSLLGFRGAETFPKQSSAPRILFLGDSYTEGSASELACNYPNVAIATLNAARVARGAPAFEVMNAGVAGYGPVESLALYHYLVDEGYRFDAVVFSLFLENDFTDDAPSTERRVVGGIVFRYPSSRFLKTFHPLNTRTARYAMMLIRARTMRTTVSPNWGQGCQEAQPQPDPLPGTMRDAIVRRLDANYGADASIAPQIVTDVIGRLARETKARGIPLLVVAFPDRVVADTALRARLGVRDLQTLYDLGRLRQFVRDGAGDVPMLDLTNSLSGRSELYLLGDTHLSDAGNVLAGRVAGARLAALLSK